MIDIGIRASDEASTIISFEPVGTTFDLTAGDQIYLRVPGPELPELEIVAWPTGIAVWIDPYPAEYIILNRDKAEIDRL